MASAKNENLCSREIDEEIETMLAISVVARRLARNLHLIQMREIDENGGLDREQNERIERARQRHESLWAVSG